MVKPETSEALRCVMRLNAVDGAARAANVVGHYVGGKTGTADKVIHGHYSKTRVLTTFMAITPADKPRYLFLTVMDEPQATPETKGHTEAAWNAGAVAGKLITRTMPLLSPPRDQGPVDPFPTMVSLGAWGWIRRSLLQNRLSAPNFSGARRCRRARVRPARAWNWRRGVFDRR